MKAILRIEVSSITVAFEAMSYKLLATSHGRELLMANG
jgi:hypothetical protein